jgi:hypothetical protein
MNYLESEIKNEQSNTICNNTEDKKNILSLNKTEEHVLTYKIFFLIS